MDLGSIGRDCRTPPLRTGGFGPESGRRLRRLALGQRAISYWSWGGRPGAIRIGGQLGRSSLLAELPALIPPGARPFVAPVQRCAVQPKPIAATMLAAQIPTLKARCRPT